MSEKQRKTTFSYNSIQFPMISYNFPMMFLFSRNNSRNVWHPEEVAGKGWHKVTNNKIGATMKP